MLIHENGRLSIEHSLDGGLRGKVTIISIAYMYGKTPGGGGYSPKIPIRVCAAQRGRDFGTPYLERGIHFRDVS